MLLIFVVFCATGFAFKAHAQLPCTSPNPADCIIGTSQNNFYNFTNGLNTYTLTADPNNASTTTSQEYSGLTALSKTFTGLANTSNLGDFLNAIIALIISLGSILAVVMFMYEGYSYIMSKKEGEVVQLAETKQNLIKIVVGFLLLLCIYTVLKTINPDLLNLTPRFADILNQIQTNSPTNSGSQSGDEQRAVVVTPTDTGFATDPTKNISQYDQFFSASAARNGVDCTLMKADMYIESGGNPRAQSGAGARGLMQIMPAVAQNFKVDFDSLFDPATNIETSSKLWDLNYKAGCNGKSSNTVCNTNDVKYVIAAYSAGAGGNKESKTCPGQTVWECPANAGYQETRDYIPKVSNAYNILKQNGWGCQ